MNVEANHVIMQLEGKIEEAIPAGTSTCLGLMLTLIAVSNVFGKSSYSAKVGDAVALAEAYAKEKANG